MEPEMQAQAIKNYYQRVYGLVRPPATEAQIVSVEKKLGCLLPRALRALYLLCDGISYPEGGAPLFWVQMIPQQTKEFREFAQKPGAVEKSEDYICFGWDEGLRYLAIDIRGKGNVIFWDPSLRRKFEGLGVDLLAAYKKLEKFCREAVHLPPEEFEA